MPLYICTKLVYSFICWGTSRLLPSLIYVNDAAVNIGVHVSFSIMIFSGYMPSSGIAGPYGSFIPSFLKESPYCIRLHFHQQCKRILFSPHPFQHLLFVAFFGDGHSDWCEVVPHCSFDLHFSEKLLCFGHITHISSFSLYGYSKKANTLKELR